MTVVQSLGALAVSRDGYDPVASALDQAANPSGFVWDWSSQDHAALWRSQPQVRIVTEAIARNMMQLPVDYFQRISAAERQDARDSAPAQMMERPNPWTSRSRFWENMGGNWAVFGESFAVKVRSDPPALVILPPQLVTPYGGLWPMGYKLRVGGAQPLDAPPSEILHFRSWNPASPIRGLSPLETLRKILAEEAASTLYRAGLWQNAARMAGVLLRPKDAPEWDDDARDRFREEFEALYSGAGGSGRTAILEEGMDWKPVTFSAQEAQFMEARMFTREEVARAYHMPPSAVGILEQANQGTLEEENRKLYRDTLGPILGMFEDETRMQIFEADFGEKQLYMEFSLREKLRGSFVEEAGVLSTAAGRPWMTLNEARAERNLGPVDGGDTVVVPLNVIEGGQPAPNQPLGDGGDREGLLAARLWKGLAELMELANGEGGRRKDLALIPSKAQTRVDAAYPRIRARHAEKYREVLAAFFGRQRRAIVSLSGAKMAAPFSILDEVKSERWDRELGNDLFALASATGQAFGERFAKQAGGSYDHDRTVGWLRANAQRSARAINESTAGEIEQALMSADHPAIPDTISHVFDVAGTARSAQIAETAVGRIANFASHEAARHSGYSSKTWTVQSDNPRASHAEIDGETVRLEEAFSNGLSFPGDPAGGADEVAGCTCSLTYGSGGE